jgi:O-succinylbenzoic acid--CoA ligase
MPPAPGLALLPAEADPAALEAAVRRLSRGGGVVGLAPALEIPALQDALGEGNSDAGGWTRGPAVVVGSGGSTGKRRWCLQPLAHLWASADATGAWLARLGVDPSTALVVNPLPWHHVSGLMPWLRAERWGAEHRRLMPAQLRHPADLARACPHHPGQTALLSLVPTQLHRLMADPTGLRWLQGFRLIWIGGAPLPAADRSRALDAGLPLAPCYGGTETGSMVTALSPEAFLRGLDGCGPVLPHARIRIGPATGAVEVRATSLSPGYVEGGRLRPLALDGGWWRSGDRGRLTPDGLLVLGRLDGAVHSGGETVFPEEVERALRTLAHQGNVPLGALLLVAQPDPEWGERLVALVRTDGGGDVHGLIRALQELAVALPPAQRPRDWRPCPELEPNALGKWERQRWREWLSAQE